jgi:hypothetical protein
MDTGMKNSIGKGHRNISTKKILQVFPFLIDNFPVVKFIYLAFFLPSYLSIGY